MNPVCHAPPQNQVMSAQRLYELDSSSTRFPKQLVRLLDNAEWVAQLEVLPSGDIEGLAGHLDYV